MDGNNAALASHGLLVRGGTFHVFNGQATSSDTIDVQSGRLDLKGANAKLTGPALGVESSGVFTASDNSNAIIDNVIMVFAGGSLNVTGGGSINIGPTSTQAPRGTSTLASAAF
jgi:hypothetical protein